MGKSRAAGATILLLLSSIGVHAQERYPFHIATFQDNRTISLAIHMSDVSSDVQYNYDVELEVREHSPSGEVTFMDDSLHLVRVRCSAPRAVKVGGSDYKLPDLPQAGDWKEDLWKSLCLQPLS